jgi:hypothetical protein
MTPEQILANFFVFDNFNLRSEGAEMEFVAERLRGEVARFDIVDKSGKVIVEDKRINAKHVRDIELPASSTSRCRKTTCSAACWPRTSSTLTPAKSSPTPTTS